MYLYVISPIDRLAASKIISVNFLTIVSISSWWSYAFKSNGFWFSSNSIFSEKRSQFGFLKFYSLEHFLLLSWFWYWILMGQWSLSLYVVSCCQSNSVVELIFVIVRSIAEKLPFETLCLVGSLLFSRMSVSSSKKFFDLDLCGLCKCIPMRYCDYWSHPKRWMVWEAV